MKRVNDSLQLHIDKRQYLHATDLLIRSSKQSSQAKIYNICPNKCVLYIEL